jgi:hypothetical protein
MVFMEQQSGTWIQEPQQQQYCKPSPAAGIVQHNNVCMVIREQAPPLVHPDDLLLAGVGQTGMHKTVDHRANAADTIIIDKMHHPDPAIDCPGTKFRSRTQATTVRECTHRTPGWCTTDKSPEIIQHQVTAAGRKRCSTQIV